MAKNYVCDGNAMPFIAPAGGVVSGTPVKIGTLLVVPLDTAAEGAEFTGALTGVFELPCTTGLTTGAEAMWSTNALAALGAEDVAEVVLVTDESGGYAYAKLKN